MLYREIIAVCSQIHTKHTNTLCGQNVELLNVKLAVYIAAAGLQYENLTFHYRALNSPALVLPLNQVSHHRTLLLPHSGLVPLPVSSYRHSRHCQCCWRLWTSVRRCWLLISVTVWTCRPLLLHSRSAQQVLLSRIMSDVMSYRFIWLPAEYRSVTMATKHCSCTLAPLSSKCHTTSDSRLEKLGLCGFQL
jgi:hypothetical protein